MFKIIQNLVVYSFCTLAVFFCPTISAAKNAELSSITLPNHEESMTASKGDVIAEGYDVETVESKGTKFTVTLDDNFYRRVRGGAIRISAGSTLFLTPDDWYCSTLKTSGGVFHVRATNFCMKDLDGDGDFDIGRGLVSGVRVNVNASYKRADSYEIYTRVSALFFTGYENGRVSLSYVDIDRDSGETLRRLDGSVAYDSSAKSFKFGDMTFAVEKLSKRKITLSRVAGHF